MASPATLRESLSEATRIGRPVARESLVWTTSVGIAVTGLIDRAFAHSASHSVRPSQRDGLAV